MLRGKERAGRPRVLVAADGLERAAARIRDHRSAARLRLDGRDTEVLLGREHERLRALHEVAERCRGLVAENLDVRSRERLYALEIAALADDHEPPLRKRAECLDDRGHFLIWHEPRCGEVEVVLPLAQRERIHVDRRIDHIGFAAIDAPDPVGDEARVRDEMVDGVRRPRVPEPRFVQQPAREERARAAREARVAQVLVLHVPRVAHRRVDVSDVQLIGPREHPLADRRAARENDVVAAEIELLDREHQERQVVPIVRAHQRPVLRERRDRVLALKERALVLRQHVDRREHVGRRIQRDHLLEHALAADVGREPVVHERDARRAEQVRVQAHVRGHEASSSSSIRAVRLS